MPPRLAALAASRYTTAGLAHSAADALTESGFPHEMAFAPRSARAGSLDRSPFIVRPVVANAR